MKKNIVISCPSFLYFIKQIFSSKKKSTDFYFDFYSKSQNYFIWVLIKLINREHLSKWLCNIFSIFGVTLKKIAHASAVDDYHLLNVKAHKIASDIAENYIKNHFMYPVFFPEKVITDECQRSLAYKQVTDRLWHVVENILVLRSQGKMNISVRFLNHEFPDAVVQLLAKEMDIEYQLEPDYSHYIFTPIILLFFAIDIISKYFKAILPFSNQNINSNAKISVELAGPDSFSGSATHADYLLKHAKDQSDFIYYVRGERASFFRNGDIGNRKSQVVFLNKLKPDFHIISDLILIYSKIIKHYFNFGASSYILGRFIQQARLYYEFSLFLCYFQPMVHIYNTFTNAASIGVRLDSGLISGLCRFHNVKSVTYQTRVMYLHSYFYYYDVFDIYCTWGDAWKKLIEDRSYITAYYPIGNVYNVDFEKQSLDFESDVPSNSIVLFNSDIEMHFPQHHTACYNLAFFKIVFEAVSLVSNKPEIIYLKAKNSIEADKIRKDSVINELQAKSGIRFEIIDEHTHDFWPAVARADTVISIGFTTPGACALSAGKKSIYVTPYQHEYNDVFPAKYALLAYNAGQLSTMLETSDADVAHSFLEDIDRYADANSSERLYQLCSKLTMGGIV